jgi:hypothetical protein
MDSLRAHPPASVQHNGKEQGRYAIGLLVAIFLGFSFLAIRNTHDKAFWGDEIWSLHYAGAEHEAPISLSETVARVSAQSSHENNPPGYYVLLNLWTRLTGASEFAARALSVMIGLVTVAFCARLGDEFARYAGLRPTNRVGLSTASVIASSALLIYYAQEVRAYILMVCLSAGTVAMYLALLRVKRPPVGLMVGLVLAVAAIMYTHFFGLLALGWLAGFHIFLVPRNRRWFELSALLILGLAPFLLWAGVFWSAMTRVGGNTRTVTLAWTELPATILYAFSMNSLPLFALLWLMALKQPGRKVWFLLTMLALACLSLAALDAYVPLVTQVRYTLWLWPFLALFAGLGIDWLASEARGPFLPLLLLLFALGTGHLLTPGFIASLHDLFNGTRMPWLRFSALISTYGQSSDKVFFHSPGAEGPQDHELQFYMSGLLPQAALTESILGVARNDEYFHNAQVAIASYQHIWLGIDQTLAPNFRLNEFQRALALKFDSCGTVFNERAMRLELYAQALERPVYFFENGIGAEITLPPATDRTKLGSTLLIPIRYTLEPNTDVDVAALSVALHLEDRAGSIRAQADPTLPPEAHSCRLYALETRQLPPGEYSLYFTIYNWQTGKRLTSTSERAQADARLLIGTIRLE